MPWLCAQVQSGGLSHSQKAEKGLPQTLPSPYDTSVTELLVALQPNSWKLHEVSSFFRQKRAILT